MQGVNQHAHVPAGDYEDNSIAEQACDSGAVLGDHRPVVWLPRLVELTADVADAAQVRRVEVADGGHGLGQFADQELVVAAAALDGVDRLQRMVQAQQVDVLHLVQHPLQLPLGHGELRIAILYLKPSPVQGEIDIAGAEPLAQHGVGWLALLPPGGDGGDRPLEAQRCGDRVQRRPALRT